MKSAESPTLEKTLFLCLLLLTFLVAPGTLVYADEGKPTGDMTVSVLSKYVWRGQEFSRNSVVVQPSFTVSYNGFSANLWGNMDINPYSADSDESYGSYRTETDVSLSYSKTFGSFIMSIGYLYYGLGPANQDAPNPPDAQELFASVGIDSFLSPNISVYKEINNYHNWYFLLSASYTSDLNKAISLKLAATWSYLASTDETTYPEYDKRALASTDKFSNFHDGTLSLSLLLKTTPHITLAPTICYVYPLSDDAKNEIKGRGIGGKIPEDRDSSFLYGGLTASFTF